MHIHSILEKETNRIILINTFIIKDSSKQQKVADMLEDASKQIISKHDGFISTRIHKSLDGTKVMSYVQWENNEAIENMLDDPSAMIHMNDITKLTKVDRTLFELVYTQEKETK
jgi:heme-degrading monooxygenase HmoA